MLQEHFPVLLHYSTNISILLQQYMFFCQANNHAFLNLCGGYWCPVQQALDKKLSGPQSPQWELNTSLQSFSHSSTDWAVMDLSAPSIIIAMFRFSQIISTHVSLVLTQLWGKPSGNFELFTCSM